METRSEMVWLKTKAVVFLLVSGFSEWLSPVGANRHHLRETVGV